VGLYRNLISTVVFLDDSGSPVKGPAGVGRLSEERARAILLNRPGSLERVDVPTKAEKPAPKKPEAKPKEAKTKPAPEVRADSDIRSKVMSMDTPRRAQIARALGFKGRRSSAFIRDLPNSRLQELKEAAAGHL